MTVDQELQEFEDHLWNSLEFNLVTGPDMDYWREIDLPPALFLDVVRQAIEACHVNMIQRYRQTAVEPILLECQRFLTDIVWAAMSVPFPNFPELHARTVVDNIIHLYNIRIYARLRTEMIMVHHNAAVLQRNWRRIITDPEHPACRRRLLFEFNNLEQLLV